MSAEAPKGSAWCGLHDIYYREANGGCWYCLGEERPGQFVTLDPYAAHHRGAFRVLAEVGLAVAYGQLYACAAAQVQFASNRYGRVALTTSVDAWYLQLAMRGCLP